MELKMYINNNLVDSLPVSIKQAFNTRFLEHIKHDLEEKHKNLIEQKSKPLYFIGHLPSIMERKKG
ncbi:MAG: hypothetical protein NVS1B13_15650 [Flavisolibacter sp.]